MMNNILIIFVLILGVGIVFFIKFYEKNKSTKDIGSINKNLILNKWQEIENLSNLGGVYNLNSAVLEADKIFDYALKAITHKTEGTMGDRLKLSQKKFSRYDIYQGVWEAHKLRNRIAHEIDSEVLSLESKRAILKFKTGLKDLMIL